MIHGLIVVPGLYASIAVHIYNDKRPHKMNRNRIPNDLER